MFFSEVCILCPHLPHHPQGGSTLLKYSAVCVCVCVCERERERVERGERKIDYNITTCIHIA